MCRERFPRSSKKPVKLEFAAPGQKRKPRPGEGGGSGSGGSGVGGLGCRPGLYAACWPPPPQASARTAPGPWETSCLPRPPRAQKAGIGRAVTSLARVCTGGGPLAVRGHPADCRPASVPTPRDCCPRHPSHLDRGLPPRGKLQGPGLPSQVSVSGFRIVHRDF